MMPRKHVYQQHVELEHEAISLKRDGNVNRNVADIYPDRQIAAEIISTNKRLRS